VITEHSTLPKTEEGLANYVQRLRGQLSLTQKELSFKAGIHIQTIRKIEGGQTSRLNQKAKGGLAVATCNTNRSNLQSRHFQTRIICNYNFS
jgi:DNA-binding XRE family transcriptional regulator